MSCFSRGRIIWNILNDCFTRARLVDGSCIALSLPQVYESLFARRIVSFTALRPHQRHAWHALLSQLGALACIRAGLEEPPSDAATWERILRGLTPEFPDDEPWSLVAPPDRPAFLQPVVGPLEGLKSVATPDQLDMLVTARNHDLKGARMAEARADDWLYALATLQTMEGFLGAGNYGASRMNGGFANRPGIGLAPRGGVGAHVMRDIRRLIALEQELLDTYDEYDEDGLALLWLKPWDGATSLPRKGLHPYYIDVCRRVRLSEAHGAISAHVGNSKAMRVAMTKEEGGVTGDPWTPIHIDDDGNRALTVDGRGFDYRRLADIITRRGYAPAPLQQFGPGENGDGWELVCRALARGQGKTEGYHERRVPIPAPAIGFLRAGDPDGRLAGIAEARVANAAKIRSALRFALMVLFQNGPDGDEFDPRDPSSDRRAEPFLKPLHHLVDHDFFEGMFAEFVEQESEGARAIRGAWLKELRRRALVLLSEAEAETPASSVRRIKASVRAAEAFDRAFYGAKELKDFLREEENAA